jgi:hypothetical protein
VKAWAVEGASGALVGPFYEIEDAVDYMTAEDENGTSECGGKLRPLMSSMWNYVDTKDVRVLGNVKADVRIDGVVGDDEDDEDYEDYACDCGCMDNSEDSEDEEEAA